MSGRKKLAVKNGLIGLFGQICSLVLQIISRKAFIQFIGEDILGLNSTFTAVLSTLSLAELGFQTAISYNLFRPLHNKDEKEVNEIVNVYRYVYRAIGILFIVVAVILLPFLKFFLKGITITTDIYIFFLIQAAASACTYFLAYKRTVLYADQKEYVYKLVDTVMAVLFKSAQIYVIVHYRSYYAYIILQLIQVYAGNLIVHFIGGKKYAYLKKTKFNREYAKKIFADAKDIFAGRIAGYVYSSTDNLIISKVLGTAKVAFIGNYTTITANIRFLINSILIPLTPIVGNYLVENENIEQQKKKLSLYTHLRYVLAMIVLIPTVVLIDDFIRFWVGERFILDPIVKFLLIADIYIQLIYGACLDYITGKGLFKQDKVIIIIGTSINLVLSIALVWRWKITGILFATVCGQIFYWFAHSGLVFKSCFGGYMQDYIKFFLKNAFYTVSFIVTTGICMWIYGNLPISSLLAKFFAGGCICELVIAVIYLIANFRTNDFKELYSLLKRHKG